MPTSPPRWRVPVRLDEVPLTGLHLDLVAAPAVRETIAAVAGVPQMSRLEAAVDVSRSGAGLRATGTVSATVGQVCVVTLEPMTSEVNEAFEVVFAPANSSASAASIGKVADGEEEPPEPLVDGVADLGTVLTECLLLGIDPYPRKPGAEFTPPQVDEVAPGPFASLAKLKN